MRQWRVPCPDCGGDQLLEWEHVKWSGTDPATAVYVCVHCHYELTNDELQTANRIGTWKPTREPDRPGLVGFHCNFLASPFVPLSWAVGEWLAANAHMHKDWQRATGRDIHA